MQTKNTNLQIINCIRKTNIFIFIQNISTLQYQPLMNQTGFSPNRQNTLFVLLIILGMIYSSQSQHQCIIENIPPIIPVSINETFHLDLNQYIKGPNISLSLPNQKTLRMPQVTLHHKFENKLNISHTLGSIVDSDISGKQYALLGESVYSVIKKYYVYMGSTDHLDLVEAIEIPEQMGECEAICINSQQTVAVLGKKEVTIDGKTSFRFTTGLYRDISQEWEIVQTLNYTDKYSRIGNYVTDNILAMAVPHPTNSYIEIMDVRYGIIISIIDRTFLGAPTFNISDIMAFKKNLYVLDYDQGLFQLQYNNNDRFLISSQYKYFKYQKVQVDSVALVLIKPGALLQVRKTYSFKYEDLPVGSILNLQITQSFITVYLENNEIVIYERGLMPPFLIEQFRGYEQVFGMSINDYQFLQILSPVSQQGSSIQVIFQKIALSPPLLQISPFEDAEQGSEINVKIQAQSKMGIKIEKCALEFRVKAVDESSTDIYESTQGSFQKLFLNQPGRAQISLSQYGVGPNLHYTVEDIQTNLNYSTQVHKLSKLEKVEFQGLNTTTVKDIFLAENCQSYTCPLVINTNTQNVIKYYTCRVISNFYSKSGINCSEVKRDYKFVQFQHYQIMKLPENGVYGFFQLSVLVSQKNQFTIIKYMEAEKGFNPLVLVRHRLEGNNTYGEDNITDIKFYPEQNLIILLLSARKQIRIFQTSQSQAQIILAPLKIINLETINPSLDFFTPLSFELDMKKNLWIKDFDRFYVVNFNYEDAVLSQIVSIINIAEAVAEFPNFGFRIVQKNVDNTIKLRESIFVGYLVIFSAPSLLSFCGLTQKYECLFGLKQLPLYGNQIVRNLEIKEDNGHIVEQLSGFQFSILAQEISTSSNKVLVYNLDEQSTPLSLYFKVDVVQSNNFPFVKYLNKRTQNPLLLVFSPQFENIKTIFTGYSVFADPTVTVILPVSNSIIKTDNIVLHVQNEEDFIRQIIQIEISNFPQNLTRGQDYPYKMIKKQVSQIYIELDSLGWVFGNVITNQYNCKICRSEPPAQKNQTWVETRNKIWKRYSISILQTQRFQVITEESQNFGKVAMVKNNLVYLLDLTTKNISSSYLLSSDPTDEIDFLSLDHHLNYAIALLERQQGRFGITIFSTNSQKGFILSEALLSPSIRYISSFYYANTLIALTEYSGVYLYLVNGDGEVREVDFIGQIEAGGDICWGELIEEGPGSYLLFVTLCKIGIVVFRIQLLQMDARVVSKQIVDFSAVLKKQSIRLPNDASFIRTLTTKHPQGYLMLALLQNFNSIQFLLKSQSHSQINSVIIKAMIHRYGDFTTTEDVSLEPINHRYLKIVYHGIIRDVSTYITAVYDLNDLQQSSTQGYDFLHCYIMETLLSTSPSQGQFVSTGTFVTLAKDGQQSSINLYNTSNAFRAVIHNYQKVYSQSLFIVPSTPTSSLSIEIFLHGIDIIEWQGWQIFLLALSGILLTVLLCLGLRKGIKEYQRKKKLVPLLIDYPQYEEDMIEQIQKQRNQTLKPQPTYKEEEDQGQISDDEEIEEIENYVRSSGPQGINYSIRGSTDQ